MNDPASTIAQPARFDLLHAESFVRGESMLAVLIDAPMALVCARLERLAHEDGHGLLARHELEPPLRAAGQGPEVEHGLRVYEVGHAELLALVVAADPGLAHAVPCRIVVHDVHGVTTVTTPRPTVIWPELSHAPQVARLARDVERGLQRLLRALQ